MRIGQLLQAILEWVKRLLDSTQAKTSKPFVSVREKQYPFGLLKLVEGRDTLHAVRTWIISPNQSSDLTTDLMDLHIYLDFVDATSTMYYGSAHNTGESMATSKEGGAFRTTHTITLMRASSTLQADGTYTYEHIFSKQYDFKGQQATPADVQARIACDRIAVLAGMCPVKDVEWPDEIEEIHRQVMGREGIPSTQAFKFWRKKKQASRSKSLTSRRSSPQSKPRAAAPKYSLNNINVRKPTKH
ncbi:MAG: hypothetical protein VKJ64_16325 [Leptolyngbyaceae bacterium]|nr:hypothetical protein [Leptolyngbyaceae bacterium]